MKNRLSISKWFQGWIVLSLLLLLSCEKNPVSPQNNDLVNVRWDLVGIDSSLRHIDISGYKTFSIVMGDSNIWATDGCNWLVSGTYVYRGDTLVLTGGGITQRGCIERTLPFDYLFMKPRVSIDPAKLTLLITNVAYYFNSDFTADVHGQQFTKTAWMLFGSNDNNFQFFDSLKLYPRLSLVADRSFQIEWHNKLSGELFINKDTGVFGINGNAGIQITVMYWSYEGNNVTVSDLYLVHLLEQSTRYAYIFRGFRLINDSNGTYYDFVQTP